MAGTCVMVNIGSKRVASKEQPVFYVLGENTPQFFTIHIYGLLL